MEQLASIHGRQAGIGPDGKLIVPSGFIAGAHGSQIEYPSPSRAVLFDDFLGDAIVGTNWGAPTKGSDGGTVDFAHLTGVNGLLKGTTGAGATTTMAVNGISLISALQWKANQSALPRKLCFEARLKISAITGISIFCGLTDALTLEAPFESAASSDTVTSNASDAVGFMFDTDMTTDNIWLVGVKGDTDATKQDSGLAFVADTFRTLRVEVDANEIAYFFIDGKPIGTAMTGALTKTVALTPVVAAFSQGAASRDVTIDYIHCAADRV